MAQPMLTQGIRLKGRYIVEALIATGGYASVYRVTDASFGVVRAMKEVVDSDAGIREQFLLEASLLAKLQHPNIPRGYDHFEEYGRAYLIMDFVEGQDLEQMLAVKMRISGQPLDEVQVIRWLLPICEALDIMHRQPVPIIHRDIKPANIKLTAQGVPILIDFGLAKRFVQGPTNQAAQGITPGFAPPEQYLAVGKTDARTDIYGMGATLYTLLTGQEPTEAPNRLLAQSGKAGAPMTPARMLNKHISAATAHIIDKAMDVGAEHRHQSANELRDDLLAALANIEYGRPYIATGETTKPLDPTTMPQTNTNVYRRKGNVETPTLTPSAQLSTPSATAVTMYPAQSTSIELPEPPWFDLGGPLLGLLGKTGLVFSAFEIYWGLLCTAALTSVIGTNGFSTPPSLLAIGVTVIWVVVVIFLTAVVVRAIDRPIARRGRISGFRRGTQGALLLLLWLGMNTAAVIFYTTLSNEIGLISLGLLALASILNGLLSAANTLA